MQGGLGKGTGEEHWRLNIKSFCTRQKATNGSLYRIIVPVTEIITIYNCSDLNISRIQQATVENNPAGARWIDLSDLIGLLRNKLKISLFSRPTLCGIMKSNCSTFHTFYSFGESKKNNAHN